MCLVLATVKFVHIYFRDVSSPEKCLFHSNGVLSLGRKKRQAEFETYLKRMMNRYKKDQLIDTHKVKNASLPVLCLFGCAHVGLAVT